jgi:hypothetical protein
LEAYSDPTGRGRDADRSAPPAQNPDVRHYRIRLLP